MGLEKFDPALAVHDLIQDLKWSVELRAEFATNEAAVLDRYPLREDERRAIETRNFLVLYDMGLHPYLGGQLARLMLLLYSIRSTAEFGQALALLQDF